MLYTRRLRGYCRSVTFRFNRGRSPRGANMSGHQAAISVMAILAAGAFTSPLSAVAQTFQSYRCADGTSFIVGFYQYDSRAFLQVDGRAITLKKRLGLSDARYSGSGVTLVIG